MLTYKYRFVVLLHIRSFVTYSWLCNMNVRSWIEMGIYMDKYICDNVFGREVSTRLLVDVVILCIIDIVGGRRHTLHNLLYLAILLILLLLVCANHESAD